MTTQELRELLREERANDWRIPLFGDEIMIKPKKGPACPLVPNPVQERFIDRIWELQQQGKPVRIVVPKARQHGISTITEAIIYCITGYQDNMNAIIVADKREHARGIFNMSKLMQDTMNPAHRPVQKRSNANELVFSENHSQIVVSTDARSGTYQIFHSSETAFYPHSEDTMLGVLQTVPDDPGTIIIMESTGNGYDPYFYPMCLGAKAGTNEYELFFIAWWENPEYSRPIPKRAGFTPMTTGPYGDEVAEKERYNLTDEQLNWRRHQIDNKCARDLRKFMQEYPARLEECFQASGSPVFDLVLLEEIQQQAQLPIWRGYIALKEIDITRNATSGPLRIWHRPVIGYENRYVMGADTGGMSDGADYSVAYVVDRIERQVVAMLHGHFDAYEYARMLVTMAKWYDKAKLAIEVNKYESETDDMGQAVIKRIIDEVKYSNMYKRRAVDEQTKRPTRKVGWHTNRETKQMIVDRMRQFTNEQKDFPLEYNDYDLIEEMKTYIIDQTDTGKTTWNAQKGSHDDRIMALGIALCVSKEMPTPRKKQKVEKFKARISPIEAVAVGRQND
ncbi:MAG: hypothetical protein EOM68_22215 [Spirochaetia bacterium]|nr:hypothetical protein [Spirochaetia bacterium]